MSKTSITASTIMLYFLYDSGGTTIRIPDGVHKLELVSRPSDLTAHMRQLPAIFGADDNSAGNLICSRPRPLSNQFFTYQSACPW